MAQRDWVLVSPEDAGFRVEMPAPPTASEDRSLRAIPASQSALFQLQVVTFTEVPADPLIALRQLLKASVGKSRVVDHPDGQAIDCSVPGNGVFRRAVLLGRRAFVMVVVVMTPSEFALEDADRFFDSLRRVEVTPRLQLERLDLAPPTGWSIERSREASPSFRPGPIRSDRSRNRIDSPSR